MEVQTVDEQGRSYRRAALYVAATVGFVVLFNVPYFYSSAYARALKTLILVIVVSMMGRLLLSAVISFRKPDTPPEVPSDAELPTVSVLIPAYNEESVLPDTIEACKAVDYPAEKLEVVLCYEADCADRTGEICETAARGDDRFVAVERDEDGGGKAAACNYGLDYCTGDVVASIDADHEFKTDALRRAARWFYHDEDVYCVKGRCYGRNPEDSLFSLHATVERHMDEKADLYARDVVGGFTIFGGGQAFFRAAAFEELGKFDEDVLVEDIDYSARLHLAGKDLRVDPEVITYEEQPTTLSTLWSQRKRWARGWLQVSARYLPKMPTASKMSVTQRLDAIHTFGYTLLLPFLIVGVPMPVYDFIAETTGAITAYTAYVPYSRAIWTVLGAFPVLMVGFVFWQDYRDGHEHHRNEYLASLTLGVFLFVQSAFYIIGFLDEWVFGKRSVYVTTTRAEAEGDADPAVDPSTVAPVGPNEGPADPVAPAEATDGGEPDAAPGAPSGGGSLAEGDQPAATTDDD